jgi:integrase
MRFCEVKGLTWRDVDFFKKTVTIRQSKTDAGRRVIPLNPEAWDAVLELYHRAEKQGKVEPSHFLFPACEYGKIHFSHFFQECGEC